MKDKRKEWREGGRKGERIGERKEVTNVCEQGVENEKLTKIQRTRFLHPFKIFQCSVKYQNTMWKVKHQ